jgi:hypothetical protein
MNQCSPDINCFFSFFLINSSYGGVLLVGGSSSSFGVVVGVVGVFVVVVGV